MSAQKTGSNYLTSYSGLLKTAEECLNVAAFISGSVCGYELKTYTINFIAIYAFTCTAFFLVFHTRSLLQKSDLPWYWIECFNCLAISIVYTLASSIAVSALTKGFILTGVFGYLAAMAYVLDMIDIFRLAVTPRAQYVWTTPHVPI